MTTNDIIRKAKSKVKIDLLKALQEKLEMDLDECVEFTVLGNIEDFTEERIQEAKDDITVILTVGKEKAELIEKLVGTWE